MGNKARKKKQQKILSGSFDKVSFDKNKEKAEKYCAELKKGTKTELLLKECLDNNGIIYEFQKPFYTDSRVYIVDFYLESRDGSRYAIELDGKSHLDRKTYDEKRTEYLNLHFGIKVIRFDNADVYKHFRWLMKKIIALKPFTSQNMCRITPKKQKPIKSIANNQERRSPGKKTKVTEEGQPCRKCGTPVIKKIPRRSEDGIKTKYVYEYYLFCPNCKTMWMIPEARILASNLKYSM